MPTTDTRRLPYGIPLDGQKSARGGARKNRTDKSKAHTKVKKTKSSRASGVEGSVGRTDEKGMAKKPKGTAVITPGGRQAKARGYSQKKK